MVPLRRGDPTQRDELLDPPTRAEVLAALRLLRWGALECIEQNSPYEVLTATSRPTWPKEPGWYL